MVNNKSFIMFILVHLRTSLLLTYLLILGVSTASAATISIINLDGVNEGFNDTSAPFSGQTGNNGSTLGQQRLNVFQAAADYWETQLVSPVVIRVGAQMNPLSCNASGGVLGQAGPEDVFRDFSGAPLSNTWYVSAIANSRAGLDLDPNLNDISATFNSAIDNNSNCLSGINWWLGIDSPAPSGTISLYDTVLHEIAHGLGMLSLVSESGVRFDNRNDAYSYHLYDISTSQFWRSMTNTQRATSARNTSNLVWRGPNADSNSSHLTAGKNSGHIRLYAPNPYQQGSSVSHWDTALSPDELMEPSATPTSDDRSTVQLLKDVGWNIVEGPGEISFVSTNSTVFENQSPATIRVARTGGHEGAVSVVFNTSNITATGGGIDYQSVVNQTINWADGELGEKTIDIVVIDDGIEEAGGETVQLSLSNVTGGAVLNTASATLTIRDPAVDDDDFLLMVVPAIVGALPSQPRHVINPQWGVINDVCCTVSSATFTVRQNTQTRSSTLRSCSVEPSFNGYIGSTVGNKSFSYNLSSSGCGSLPGSFNFRLDEAKRYLFALEFSGNDIQVNVYSQGISSAGLTSGVGTNSNLKAMKLETTVPFILDQQSGDYQSANQGRYLDAQQLADDENS